MVRCSRDGVFREIGGAAMTDRTEDFFEKAGGSAFPFVAEGGNDSGLHPELQPGMTLRDYFAAHALIGMLSQVEDASRQGITPEKTAAAAYKMSDAMLKARR